MSNTVFDFLTESFLFYDENIENNYRKIDEQTLKLELRRYREFVLSYTDEIISEITCNESLINISIESFDYLPDEDLLKQLALYLDKIIINDPIFDCYIEKQANDRIFSKFIRVELSEDVNRAKLSYAAKYMKNTTSLVVNQFIKYCPVSLLHESPKDLPLLYSKDNFSSALPDDIFNFFYERVQVKNACIDNGKITINYKKPLELGTTIEVSFGKGSGRRSMCYQYMLSEIVSLDEETGRLAQRYRKPDTIDEKSFEHWVSNSINRASLKIFKEVINEIIFSKKIKCMYLAKTDFTADLLNLAVNKPSVEQDLANLALELNLPVFNAVSLNQIINIRSNYGEAFHNFRSELNKKLVGLRGVNDSNELKTQLDGISYEMSEIQVADVDKEIKKICKNLAIDATLLTGSLIASFLTGGATMVGVAGAVVSGANDYRKYLSEVKENNAYFLWKVNKETKK